MDAKKEGRCDMFDQTNAGKERGMPIEDDDDDDGDFKMLASRSEGYKWRGMHLFEDLKCFFFLFREGRK